MPLPIDPFIPTYVPADKMPLAGSVLQPFFDSGETKALMNLLSAYSTEVVDVKIEDAIHAGSTSDKTYRHVQGSSSDTWNVTHALAKYPTVTVVDSGGSQVEGDVFYVSENAVILYFSAPFSGEAFFN